MLVGWNANCRMMGGRVERRRMRGGYATFEGEDGDVYAYFVVEALGVTYRCEFPDKSNHSQCKYLVSSSGLSVLEEGRCATYCGHPKHALRIRASPACPFIINFPIPPPYSFRQMPSLSTRPRGTLHEIPTYTPTPTSNARMFIYLPKNLHFPSPPLVVAIHYCTGTAALYHANTRYSSLAEKHGFIVLYPSSPHQGTCWDVSSPSTLSHNGGSDSKAIADMVEYAKREFGVADVFVTGSSSGGMMTQVLAATYPELFKAGAAFCGVPAGGFAGEGVAQWSDACATGKIIKTAEEWERIVNDAYPGYAGPRPRMQIWHGTDDEIIHFNNFGESVKQWSKVLGVDGEPTDVRSDYPSSGWTRLVYGDQVEGVSGKGVVHNIPLEEVDVLRFFGLLNLRPNEDT